MSMKPRKRDSEALEPGGARASGIDRVWNALVASAKMARAGQLAGVDALAVDADGGLRRVGAPASDALFVRAPGNDSWHPADSLSGEARALADLYLPISIVAPDRRYAIGHLGQSLDGHIATGRGDSYYVTGPENILHLHRMRALCSAVVVGAETVAVDDPSLTVRHVTGPNPVRVVIDPRRRLNAGYKVFTDESAVTWLVTASSNQSDKRLGSAKLLPVPATGGRLDLGFLLERLAERGLLTVFVEGGGQTVSAFLEANLLDRLQIAIARLVIGTGRPGLRLPGNDSLQDCLRPTGRAYRMGQDILFDCDLRMAPDQSTDAGLQRIY